QSSLQKSSSGVTVAENRGRRPQRGGQGPAAAPGDSGELGAEQVELALNALKALGERLVRFTCPRELRKQLGRFLVQLLDVVQCRRELPRVLAWSLEFLGLEPVWP